MSKVWDDAWGHDISLYENPILAKNGQEKLLSWTNSSLNDDHGQPIMVICFGADITKRKKIEDQLYQSRKMDAIGQLAGGIAHDFNNIIASILGSAEVLQNMEGNNREHMEFIDMIIKDSKRAASLTGKLLTFSRKEPRSFTAVDINQVIHNTVTILQRSIDKRINITIRYNAPHSIVQGNDSLLTNALLNIGINASQAMLNGGQLEFTTSLVILDEAYCKTSRFNINPGEHLKIEIRDEGPGILPENLGNVFDPFFTTKKRGKGTGLGLSVVYGIIQDHNAAIGVYSELEVGTTFYIYLPISTETLTPKKPPLEVRMGSGTILVVDDEQNIRSFLKAMIQSMGYTVLLAENGQEAVEIFQKKHENIDLVMLDMIMPVMGGKETYYKLRAIQSDCKIIISSGYSKNIDLVILEGQGLSGFIRKPYQKVELSQMLTSLLKTNDKRV